MDGEAYGGFHYDGRDGDNVAEHESMGQRAQQIKSL